MIEGEPWLESSDFCISPN